jgi:hypothetical protein
MADGTLTLFRGAATTATSNIYYSPVNTAICVTAIAITNTTGSAATATLSMAGTVLQQSTSVAANTTTYLTPQQIIYNGEKITGFASTTGVNFHITGYEV